MKTRLQVDTAQGKVTKVTVLGDRSDPVNLLGLVSTLVNVMQVFDPAAGKTDGALTGVTDSLGLMRGDDAPDIDKPRSVALPYAIVTCTEHDSHVGTAVECGFSRP